MAGLIEIPGLKGEILLSYDMTKGRLDLKTNNLALPQLAQLLTAALAETLQRWAQQDAGIIRPRPEETTNDGSEESPDAKDDHDNG